MLKMFSTGNKKLLYICFTVFVIIYQNLPAVQESKNSQIKISASVNRTKVPLNRTLNLTVTVSWIGNSQRYDSIYFENPAVINFEIIGTSITSRIETDQVFKDYAYILKPVELGMGYVENVVVKVRDTIADKDEILATQRIPIQVIDPVPEPGENNYNWLIYIIIFSVVVFSLGWVLWRRRRKRGQEAQQEPQQPIESLYLNELKEQFNLGQPNLSEDFTKLSKLFRRYLTERFGIRALEVTTDELGRALSDAPLEDNQITSILEILIRLDEIKFSGVNGSPEELNRFYTLFEGIIETFLRKAEAEESGPEQDQK